MPEQKHRQTEKQPTASFRVSRETRRQIDDLMKRWGENQSQVIIRAIQVAWAMEARKAATGESASVIVERAVSGFYGIGPEGGAK